jgi:phosphate transport system ATP-binding protein
VPHISIRNLSVSYGKQQALRQINLEIPDRQLTVVIGPSGCGKTTLLKTLNRLTDLNEQVHATGEVCIDGENILARRADVEALRKKLGYLSQRPYPLPMSIYDNVTYGPRIHLLGRVAMLERIADLARRELLQGLDPRTALREAEKTRSGPRDLLVEAYLRMAGLWDEVKDRLHTPASQLSIGQQQRLALARTLAVEPEVILADEPTSALDPISAQLVDERLRALRSCYTVVLVTHTLRHARRIADYVVYLYLGELVEHGPAEKIFGSPCDPRTQAFVTGAIG